MNWGDSAYEWVGDWSGRRASLSPDRTAVFEKLGLDPETDGYYLEEYGHVQSADQIIALEEGRREGLLEAGDLVCFLAAGTGYTWSATVLRWLG